MLKFLGCALAAGAASLAAVSAGAQTPVPASTPFVIGTFQPFGPTPAPASGTLPTIGRTRSVSQPCATMRDLVIPSYQVALHSDQRFAETRKRLPAYMDVVTDPAHKDDAVGQMLLHKLDQDVSALLQDSQKVSNALGDPRLSPDNKDPQVVAERRGMQALYDALQTRANLLSEFVVRERAATAKQGLEDSGALGARGSGGQGVRGTQQAPVVATTAPPGMPLRTGIGLADKNAITDWGSSIAAYVHQGENEAAKSFYRIAQGCAAAGR